jgi:GDP-D-mannose 3',5'-epimerase
MTRILVTGAGGFIGYHLVNHLKNLGHWVRGVDVKNPEFGESSADEFILLDLRVSKNAVHVVKNVDQVYNLAADMGGMGFISFNHSQILYNNTMINFNMLEAARSYGIQRFFFSSSACVYPEYRQQEVDSLPLKEEDVYPAAPQDAYGWEKLHMEHLCQHYYSDYGVETRVARFHNTYGPFGTWRGGREKAPAALCRKIAVSKLSGNPEIEIWGDGLQTRSFIYVDDTVRGIVDVMNSDYHRPLNIGSDRMISINDLARMIAKCAGIEIVLKHVEGPQGVRGRNSDNTLAESIIGSQWETPLEKGLKITYDWIESQIWEIIINEVQ